MNKPKQLYVGSHPRTHQISLKTPNFVYCVAKKKEEEETSKASQERQTKEVE